MEMNEIDTNKVEAAVKAAIHAALHAGRKVVADRKDLTPAERKAAQLAISCVANWAEESMLDLVGEAIDVVAEELERD